MKKFLITCFLIAGSISMGFVSNDFDNDLSLFRKKVFSLCAQLQEPNVKLNKVMLDQVDQIILAWGSISSKYKNNPPLPYSNDPAWALYFDEAKDNFMLMRENVAKGNIKRAVQFCGSNCMLFVKMHKINGNVGLADMMFDLRSSIKMIVSMANAGNWNGVDNQINQCDTIMKGLQAQAKNHNNDSAQQDIVKEIVILWDKFKSKIQSHDKQSVKEGLVVFLKQYNQLYYEVL